MLKLELVLQVDDNKKLGEWVGLCKIDREGKPRKVVGCSCVVVKVNVAIQFEFCQPLRGVKNHRKSLGKIIFKCICQSSAGAVPCAVQLLNYWRDDGHGTSPVIFM